MKEHEIRPEALLKKYIELSASDAKKYFDKTHRQTIVCVACGEIDSTCQFSKNGFAYSQCIDCSTLFQNPRPSHAAFENFYRDSESSRYWADVFFPAVAEIRRKKIFRPRVDRLNDICREKNITVECLIDVGAGYGIFLDEWRSSYPSARFIAVEPSTSLANECRNKNLEVVEDIVENVNGYDNLADLVTCFEVLEHAYDPLDFIHSLKRLVRPGGYVFVSTLCINGFDLQVLWDKSGQISPPHHINFLSIDGFERLFKRAGLVDVTVTTPGQLDLDIIRNAHKNDADILDGQRFLTQLLTNSQAGNAFQKFLVEQRMSSHAWVIGQKQDND